MAKDYLFNEVRKGDTIVFVEKNERKLATATVFAVTPALVIADYKPYTSRPAKRMKFWRTESLSIDAVIRSANTELRGAPANDTADVE